MPDREKVSKAADELEDIAMLAKIMVLDLRAGLSYPYARVYWLRWKLSKVVQSLGVGVPSGLSTISATYDDYLQRVNERAIQND